MTYSNIVMLASSAFVALIVISSAAPIIEQQSPNQQQPQSGNQNSQISNGFMPDMFADYNRFVTLSCLKNGELKIHEY
uniref:Uncharacterized protein n=1 Tax=Panagrolaimus sp. ES5 TaxID=591445 RepID=A0AC34FT55_9BILA